MTKCKSLLALLMTTAISLGQNACVTAGPGAENSAVAGIVVVFSHLAISAQNNDPSAKKAWCGVFNLVNASVQTEPSQERAQDDAELTEKLTPGIHNIMRENGYQLHRQQIAIVIKDALNVSRNQEALKATSESCQGI